MDIILGFAVLIFAIGYFSGRAKARYEENIGEELVNNILDENFTNEKYYLLKNVTLPIKGGTTQIDHILVSTKGIFVIETKHYSGWIFGGYKQSKWMQTTRRGKYIFQNPLHQNYRHIKELERYFEFLPENSFKSVIVFTGKGQFKTKMPENVIYSSALVDYISKYGEELISLNRVFFVIGKLEYFRKDVSLKTDKEHSEYLKLKYNKNYANQCIDLDEWSRRRQK